ncbi:glycosyltransferase family 1 protein [Lasiosphaeris hirsuta]|uniref:Glycosyltransferase family 1 protein n=1 Tax=Lasiosphaeris hirsuta TaxID=260670 RepID=A0AA40AFV0_9PEZI|nr:glycosyltransferase family 1 protein [Lasiosphaeris hirsuta]
MGSIPAPKRVLLLTNSEHGQANVYLATSYALLTLPDEDVEVHFGSFPPIQKFVSATSEHAQRDSRTRRPILFHTIDGLDMVSAWSRPEIVAERESLKDNVNTFQLIYAIRRMMLLLKVTLPWTGPEFVQIMASVVDIVHEVQPDIIAVDPAFSPALTALRHIGTNFIVLSPNTIKDFAMPSQPNGEALWKYPWYNPTVANLPELEFPLSTIPANIIACGPMLRPATPIKEADAGLAAWLARGPTLYINLGTHMFFDERFAVEMATAIRLLLDHLMPKGRYPVHQPGCAVHDILGKEMEKERVLIVEWIEAEPTAVLEAGTVVCTVHHGGSNSFLESVSAGIPQVVLPFWMDTYDFARRAEILGIGRWGNRETEELCKGSELGGILIDVMVGGRSSFYARRANELAELCRKSGGGRVVAARRILAEIGNGVTRPPPPGGA